MRILVIDIRVTVEGDSAKELAENLKESMDNINDTLIQFGAVEKFTIKERKVKVPS